jgi:KDO2-lipid IV(A) lauroyltransferase
MPKAELQGRFTYTNPEIFDPLFQQNKSAILLGSHYGNWEWGVLSFPLAVRHKVIGIYKPVNNKKIDAYLNQLRQRWGLHLRSMEQAGRAIAENQGQPCIFVLIADQTPSNVRDAHWADFLHQDTPFLHGPAKLATKTGFPVFIFEINRVKRGHYQVTFKPLSLSPASEKETAITELFVKHLEAQILQAPAHWLWSHRRWKRQRKQPLGPLLSFF